MNAARPKPPYFSAIQPRTWTPNRVYRVYVLPDEWVGVWAGRGDDVTMMAAAQGGLIGGLLAVAANPAKKNARRAEELDAKPLEELRDDHKHNFSVHVHDIEEAEAVGVSFWFRINHASVGAVGLLRLRMSDGSKLTLALRTEEDVRRVLELLPAQLGAKFRSDLPMPPAAGAARSVRKDNDF